MPTQQKQVARVVLVLLTLAGLIPAALMAYSWLTGGSGSIHQWLGHPALPAVFMLLFVLGAGISIYLSNRWFLPLLLPLLYLALVPLFIDGLYQKPQIFYGQTVAGEGFKVYDKKSWTIQVDYPQHIARAVQAHGENPVILASLGGKTDHWMALGSNSIYPYENIDQEGNENWYKGFSLYLADRFNKRDLKPDKGKWFVSYIVLIPED